MGTGTGSKGARNDKAAGEARTVNRLLQKLNNDRLCVKCGATEDNTQVTRHGSYIHQLEYVAQKEVLVVTCWRCGFEWETPTKDSER